MKTRSIFTALAIPATAVGLFAQQENVMFEAHGAAAAPVLIAQGPIGFAGLSADPGAVKFLNEEFSFTVNTVANAPYSGEEKTESVQTLADGTRITNTSTTRVFRDSKGRVRREIMLPSPDPANPSRTMVSIFDPVAGVNYTLDSENKVAHQAPAPSVIVAQMKNAAEAKIKAEGDAIRTRTFSQTQTFSTGTGPRMEYRVLSRALPGVVPQREDLGTQTVEGVEAKGTRETSVIATGAVGNDRPITIVSERWYSPELQIELKSVRNDPRMGQTTHALTGISRTEPDPSLFQPPADYTVEQSKPGTFRFEKRDIHSN